MSGMRRRSLLAIAGLPVAGCAALPPEAEGFALVSAQRAARLDGAPATAVAAVRRAAAREATREPHAMARVHVEGTLPHQGIYDESALALRDLPAARDLALAGCLAPDPAATAAAARLCGAWVATYAPSFNPIDETGFEALFIAWDLLPAPYRVPHRAAYARLVSRFADGYPGQTLRGATATNNWNSHRVKLATLASFATGTPDRIARARERFIAQLWGNIDPSGEVIDFRQRDALHYVIYSLEPLLMACLAANRHGQDWFHDADDRLPRALGWLRPFLDGARQHVEFANTTIAFDRTRRAAGLPGFDGPFKPAAARTLLAMAMRLDPAWAPLARALKTEPWQDAWLDVIWPA